MKRISTKLFLGAVALLTACAGLPVRGRVGEQAIDTRVDSEVARYYLANYLSGRVSDARLDEHIAALYRKPSGSLPDRAELKRLSEEFSPDFAAAYFADRIGRVPENRRFGETFGEFRRAFTQNRFILPQGASEYEVVFVPTYLYKRLPIIGSDFAVPKKAMQKAGIAVHFVETIEDGAVETNAEIVATAIAARERSGRRLILISASKSGPEVALALTQMGVARTRHVAAWINVVGALQGTPLADERVLSDVEDLVGTVDSAGVESLMTERSRRRFAGFHVPDHIVIVNYFGIPFSGSVSSWARPSFGPLSKYGPNDGILLLADMVFPGGITVTELGLDHFLLDRHIDAAAVGLVASVIAWSGPGAPKPQPVTTVRDRGAAKLSREGRSE
jgi:hypothetical protein